MPGPPPPPPMAPATPAPPTFSLPKAGADNRGALLKSIRQGTKLKKTVTVDKSAPMISGKINIGNNNSAPTGGNNISTTSTPNGLPLSGLFAGGMPKLKPTGRLGPSALTSNTNINNNGTDNPSPKLTPSKNYVSIQDQLKKQLHNPSDTRHRGPPPPAPTRNISVDESRNLKPLSLPENSSNGLHSSQSSLQANISSLHTKSNALHRKSKSNANLSSLDYTDSVNNSGYQSSKPVINHGKPNLAPKPPILNGKPAPPSKLIMKPNKPISRAQSMRSPRSPSPQSPTANDIGVKFGTVRNISSVIGQSLANSQGGQNPRQRPPLTMRPSVPPPSVPPPNIPPPSVPPPSIPQATVPPSKVNAVKPPNHAPPPPPGVPQAPSVPPPPPPHKTQPAVQPMRPPPAVPALNNNTNPPPPPPRHSSMRDVNQPRRVVDLEEKFRRDFTTPDRFPKPPPYKNVLKLYTNRQESSC